MKVAVTFYGKDQDIFPELFPKLVRENAEKLEDGEDVLMEEKEYAAYKATMDGEFQTVEPEKAHSKSVFGKLVQLSKSDRIEIETLIDLKLTKK